MIPSITANGVSPTVSAIHCWLARRLSLTRGRTSRFRPYQSSFAVSQRQGYILRVRIPSVGLGHTSY